MGQGTTGRGGGWSENLVFNSKFPRFGWERAPSRWNTRCGLARSGMTPVGIETKTFATRARARNHYTMECLPRLVRCPSLGGEGFLEGREERLEIYFWILNFRVQGSGVEGSKQQPRAARTRAQPLRCGIPGLIHPTYAPYARAEGLLMWGVREI